MRVRGIICHLTSMVNTTKRTPFALLAIGVALFSFGLTMIALALAYTSDLSLLASAPMAIWSALCGQPGTNPLILPMLITMSMLSILVGLVLVLVYSMRKRRM
jgi:hypothetical protein